MNCDAQVFDLGRGIKIIVTSDKKVMLESPDSENEIFTVEDDITTTKAGLLFLKAFFEPESVGGVR
ncbi:MAG TPA: hypothetical protein VKR59_07800 [Terriglobales bacterium]|nr:hypothetical protein [Terriglobales bacterium]